MDYNEALKVVQAGRVADVKDLDELRSGLAALHLHFANYRDPSIKAALDSFENEISRRKQQEDAKTLHQSAMAQGKNLHGETMGELDKLKSSVDRLGHPRWIDWAILAVGAIAAIAAVVSLFLKH
jgi:endonuclease IV